MDWRFLGQAGWPAQRIDGERLAYARMEPVLGGGYPSWFIYCRICLCTPAFRLSTAPEQARTAAATPTPNPPPGALGAG